MTRMSYVAGITGVLSSVMVIPAPANPPGGALAGNRPRIIISTDIGGSDPDDFQSMVHFLVHSDVFDTEGLISSPPGAGRVQHILDTIAAYEDDYDFLRSNSLTFPAPDDLRGMAKQGAIVAAPTAGFSTPTEGSNWIIQQARRTETRPLYILVWGSITDVAQAIHDDPGIKGFVRVYSIGSWNTQQDPNARNYLYQNHNDFWWIEADTTFRGMYVGGDQSGDLGNLTFVQQHVKGHGALGDFFWAKKQDIKMGDTPSLMYLLRGEPDSPTSDHWGGRFQVDPHGPSYWRDLTDPLYRESTYNGAKTVNQWREQYLREWQKRMDWAAAPGPPLIALSTKAISRAVDYRDSLGESTFGVSNRGIGTLNYRIEDDADWLDLNPATGASTGEEDTIIVSYGVDTLPIGLHTATIQVLDNGSVPPAANSPQRIAVTIRVKSVLPDLDQDGDVDVSDFGSFQACFSDVGAPPIAAECLPADFNGDAIVDQADFALFQACMSAPDVLADKACDDGLEQGHAM
jgi:hypothetical protein